MSREHDEPKELIEFARRHRFARRLINFLVLPSFLIALGLTREGRRLLRDDPEIIRLVFDKELRTGLLEDAVLFPFLYVPTGEQSLEHYHAGAAGHWVAYDFHRSKEFGRRARTTQEGSLFAFPLEKIINNTPDTYTPTPLIEPLDVCHIYQFMKPTIEQLLEFGLMKETTYASAFKKAGVYSRYANALRLLGLEDKMVYSITPKGNGLVFLDCEGGKKVKKPEPERDLKLAPALVPVRVPI